MKITPQILLTPSLIVTLLLAVSVSGYDCYDQKCEGRWEHLGDYISCDNRYSRCRYDKSGRPRCVAGTSGSGVDCSWPYECGSYKTTGNAYCGENFTMMVMVIAGPAILITTISICYMCCCRRKCLSRKRGDEGNGVTIQQRAPSVTQATQPLRTQPPVPPEVVIGNVNVVTGPLPSSSNQGYYGATDYTANTNNTNDKLNRNTKNLIRGSDCKGLSPSAIPPYAIPSTAMPPTAMAPTAMAPTAMPPYAIPSTAMPSTAMPPSTMPPSTMPPTAMAPTAMAPTAMAPSTMAPTTMPPTAMPPYAIPTTTMPPTAMVPTAMPPYAIPTTAMPPSTMAPTTMPPSAMPSAGLAEHGLLQPEPLIAPPAYSSVFPTAPSAPPMGSELANTYPTNPFYHGP